MGCCDTQLCCTVVEECSDPLLKSKWQCHAVKTVEVLDVKKELIKDVV